jgi:hypothetical protein
MSSDEKGYGNIGSGKIAGENQRKLAFSTLSFWDNSSSHNNSGGGGGGLRSPSKSESTIGFVDHEDENDEYIDDAAGSTAKGGNNASGASVGGLAGGISLFSSFFLNSPSASAASVNTDHSDPRRRDRIRDDDEDAFHYSSSDDDDDNNQSNSPAKNKHRASLSKKQAGSRSLSPNEASKVVGTAKVIPSPIPSEKGLHKTSMNDLIEELRAESVLFSNSSSFYYHLSSSTSLSNQQSNFNTTPNPKNPSTTGHHSIEYDKLVVSYTNQSQLMKKRSMSQQKAILLSLNELVFSLIAEWKEVKNSLIDYEKRLYEMETNPKLRFELQDEEINYHITTLKQCDILADIFTKNLRDIQRRKVRQNIFV